MGRFSEDEGEQAQADFLVLGGPFAHLRYEKGKSYLSLTQEESSGTQFLPETWDSRVPHKGGSATLTPDDFLLLTVTGPLL